MEVQNHLQDQENINGVRGKLNITRRQGTALRGALGEISTNVAPIRDFSMVKATAANFERKAKCANIKSYNHIQSKIDTGISNKNKVQSTRPPLRREESTAGLATRAALHTQAAVKDCKNNTKESSNIVQQAKKAAHDIRKPTKLKENVASIRPVLKESTVSLSKLKINENLSVKNIKKSDVRENSLGRCTNEPATPVLPPNIEDIDAKDHNKPILMSTYIKDIYRYLTELEKKYPVETDHLKKQPVITGTMRATLIDWLVELQTQFSLLHETWQICVGIIDLYLQVVNVQKDRLQLIGVTAMLIACKYEEIYAPNVDDFVYVSDNAYTKEDIIKCEREMLSKLGFHLTRPIPISFLRRFVKVAQGTSKTHHLAKYFVDLCLVDYSMAHYHPSELAAAAVCLSMHILTNKSLEEVWTPSLAYYSSYELNHIDPIIRNIAKIVKNVGKSKHKAVYNKYLDPTLAKVSGLPQLKSFALDKLVLS
ncbi:unnamed protein product [Leptidea sinapis]|uniref:Cyclin N-terminal domain-containing protein n=1 Tax=Leptidea sinapis TaxID=189913 RepID=A0A5E4R130_9NEOP|nr:unnamed protein product [Leptidea sinapis]